MHSSTQTAKQTTRCQRPLVPHPFGAHSCVVLPFSMFLLLAIPGQISFFLYCIPTLGSFGRRPLVGAPQCVPLQIAAGRQLPLLALCACRVYHSYVQPPRHFRICHLSYCKCWSIASHRRSACCAGTPPARRRALQAWARMSVVWVIAAQTHIASCLWGRFALLRAP